MANLSYRNNARMGEMAHWSLVVFTAFWTLCYTPVAALVYPLFGTFDAATTEKLIITYAVLFFLMWALGLATAVIYAIWFFRAYHNLELMGRGMAFHRAWAIVAWFTPIVSIGQPSRMMEEMLDSYYMIRSHFPGHWAKRLISRSKLKTTTMVWWVAYTGFWILTYLEWFHFEGGNDSTNSQVNMGNYPILYSIGMIAYTFAGIMGIIVLRHVRDLESEIARIWESGEFQQRVEEVALAKAQKQIARQPKGKAAQWYQKPDPSQPAEKKGNDPFSE